MLPVISPGAVVQGVADFVVSDGNYGGDDFRTLILAEWQFTAMQDNRALNPASYFDDTGEPEAWDYCVDVAYAYYYGGMDSIPYPDGLFPYTYTRPHYDGIEEDCPGGRHVGGTWFFNR